MHEHTNSAGEVLRVERNAEPGEPKDTVRAVCLEFELLLLRLCIPVLLAIDCELVDVRLRRRGVHGRVRVRRDGMRERRGREDRERGPAQSNSQPRAFAFVERRESVSNDDPDVHAGWMSKNDEEVGRGALPDVLEEEERWEGAEEDLRTSDEGGL